jgi:hypothetical protein
MTNISSSRRHSRYLVAGGQTILATYRQPKDSLTITTFDCTVSELFPKLNITTHEKRIIRYTSHTNKFDEIGPLGVQTKNKTYNFLKKISDDQRQNSPHKKFTFKNLKEYWQELLF